jgi:5-methylcytosine-specific restriction endonuclease McrA
MTTSREWKRAYNNKWMRDRRAEAVAAFGGCCVRCGSTEVLQFDHIDPATKTTHRIWAMSKARREAELAKCQLLCAACHREKTKPELRAMIASREKVRSPHGEAEYQEWRKRYLARVAARQKRGTQQGAQ